MLEQMLAFIKRKQLLTKGDSVVVGYSGGADSACLLHLLTEAGFDVTAAHLHHGMRPEADEEVELCRDVAKRLNIPLLVGRADVPAISRDAKISLEEAGRRARYEFLARCASGKTIATAHTLDDHVETMLINLARGTGLSGLRGIRAKRDNIVRPLLFARRSETRSYCESKNIPFHDDPANTDPKNTRTTIRQNAITALLAVNEHALENAARATEIIEEEDKQLDAFAARMLEDSLIESNSVFSFLLERIEVKLDRKHLQHYPRTLQRRGIRLAAASLGAFFEFEQVERILSAHHPFAETAQGGEVVAEIEESTITVRRMAEPQPFRQLLSVPGEMFSEEGNWHLSASRAPTEESPLSVVIDQSKTKGDLFVRNLQPGEKLTIAGRVVKVSEKLAEQGVPAAAKKRMPVVCDLIGPFWIPGMKPDDRVAYSPAERPLCLKFGPVPTDRTVY